MPSDLFFVRGPLLQPTAILFLSYVGGWVWKAGLGGEEEIPLLIPSYQLRWRLNIMQAFSWFADEYACKTLTQHSGCTGKYCPIPQQGAIRAVTSSGRSCVCFLTFDTAVHHIKACALVRFNNALPLLCRSFITFGEQSCRERSFSIMS